MGLLSVSLTFVGYLLVYASVANHGKFAKEPWLGVTSDAYEAPDASSNSGAPPTGGSSSNSSPGATSVIPRGTNTAGRSPVPT